MEMMRKITVAMSPNEVQLSLLQVQNSAETFLLHWLLLRKMRLLHLPHQIFHVHRTIGLAENSRRHLVMLLAALPASATRIDFRKGKSHLWPLAKGLPPYRRLKLETIPRLDLMNLS